ncbi:MAG TPA: hypothetical protein VF912_15150 [Anaeromyxobacter sp.]
MLRSVALAVSLAASLASGGAAAVEDVPPEPDEKPAPPPDEKPAPAPDEKPAPAPDEKAAPAEGAPAKPAQAQTAEAKEDTWLDASHAFIERRIFSPVLRIDRFFSDERDLEAERGRSFLRWRNQVRLAEHLGMPGYTTTLSASLRFPGVNKQLNRLRIEIVGQTRDAVSALFPGERAAPGEVPTPEENFGTADAGLGFRLWETLQTHGDLGAGVLARLPPGVYGRVRLRFVEPVGRKVLARQAVTGFWRTDTLWGSTGSAELERPLARSVLARLSGSTTITQRSRGYEWFGDLSLLASLDARIGAQLGFSVGGATRAPVDVDTARFYTRLRRDFYRRWIFFELEPEYAWPWTPERGRHGVWAVALRLEVQFQGNEASRPPPAEAPSRSEPRDPPPAPAPHAPGSPATTLPAAPAAG